jgi:hypothetical protein
VIRCRCIWQNVRCEKGATQEDGLCDWCGTRRPEDLRDNPFAMFDQEGAFLGLAGGTVTGYNHQAGWDGIPDDVRPTACWFPDSGRLFTKTQPIKGPLGAKPRYARAHPQC